MHVLLSLLEGVQDGEISFWSSLGNSMNDKGEGYSFLSNLFLDSTESETLVKKPMEEYRQTHGDYYVLSFTRTRRDMPFGNAAMWLNYADGGKGAMLRFTFKSLKEEYGKDRLIPCAYCNSSMMKKNVTRMRNKIKKHCSDDILQEAYKEAYSTKMDGWSYEDEWRILSCSKSPEFRVTPKGIIPYITTKVPLSALAEIMIGPCADFELCEKSLIKIREKTNAKYDISQCKLLIN